MKKTTIDLQLILDLIGKNNNSNVDSFMMVLGKPEIENNPELEEKMDLVLNSIKEHILDPTLNSWDKAEVYRRILAVIVEHGGDDVDCFILLTFGCEIMRKMVKKRENPLAALLSSLGE